MASQANTILDTLKTELVEYIKVSRGYDTDLAECKRGVYQFDEILNKPATAILCYNNNVKEYLMNNTMIKTLDIYIYMYVDSIEGLHDLFEDVEKFLCYDFTYKSDVTIKDAPILEAGISDPTSRTELNISIDFIREI